MSSRYWIKLYHEILDDEKMGLLPAETWRFCIELFLYAGELDCNGTLPNVTKIAWRLRHSETQVEEWLVTLSKLNIVERNENGWIVVHFEERQDASPVKERVKQYRQRQKREGMKRECNEDVTEMKRKVTPDTDTDTDTNVVGDKSPGPKRQLMGIFQDETKLPMPKRKTDVAFWWSSIGEILAMVDGDNIKAGKITRLAIQQMKKDELTISNPNSIINVCRSIVANGAGKIKLGAI